MRKWLAAFIVALLAHGLLFAALFLHFQKHAQHSIGNKALISVYLTQAASHAAQQQPKQKTGQTKQTHKINHASRNSKQQLAGQQQSPTLIKLHKLIQERINADATQIPGFLAQRKASIQFQLNQQGKTQDIKLLQSTNSHLLNSLAINAVKATQLKAPALVGQRLNVQVVFN